MVEQRGQLIDELVRLHAAFWDRPLPSSVGFLRPWRLARRWRAC